MVSFSLIDYIALISLFVIAFATGIYFSRKTRDDKDDFLLSSRKTGLFLFICINVTTWYGGILGVGEFAYRYGLLSWFSQGLPYYFFAVIFALFFVKKIKNGNFVSIPEKVRSVYGNTPAVISAILVFLIVSPAPYFLMSGIILELITGLNFWLSISLVTVILIAILSIGGFAGNLYTDMVLFFVMFSGFIIALFVLYNDYGGIDFIVKNVPSDHLSLTGGANTAFVIVWFLIASWTLADPGFYQRTFAAKNTKTARNGILISILLWFLFDFLTNSTGLYAKAILPGIENPLFAFPLLAEQTLGAGVKGIFFAALLGVVFTTLNSFFFISGTTLSVDIFPYLIKRKFSSVRLPAVTGLVISALLSLAIIYFLPSVIDIWYTIGSICIPPLLFVLAGAYFEKLKLQPNIVSVQMVISFLVAAVLLFAKNSGLLPEVLAWFEPMFAGFLSGGVFYITKFVNKKET
ncbi:MAG: sodium:solute symporter family protein [Ignavibacteriaceae bacterium]|nr:sodium:solute symporter family protein [Ignavibacteriaceae bacterium]